MNTFNINTAFPTITITSDGGQLELPVVSFAPDNNSAIIVPYMNFECDDEFLYYRASKFCETRDVDKTFPTNDMNHLCHKDVVLFNCPKVTVEYELMASDDTEDNVVITKDIRAKNGQSFTMREFVEVTLSTVYNDYKYHLPFSATTDDEYPNAIENFTVHADDNKVVINMMY
jgi:hypothetical protein